MNQATSPNHFEWPFSFSLSAFNFPEYPLAISLYIIFCLMFMGLLWIFLKPYLPKLLWPLITLLLAIFFSPVYIEGNPSYFAPAWVGILLGFITKDYNLFWLSLAPLFIGLGVFSLGMLVVKQFLPKVES